jgi:hypothetical protein
MIAHADTDRVLTERRWSFTSASPRRASSVPQQKLPEAMPRPQLVLFHGRRSLNRFDSRVVAW